MVATHVKGSDSLLAAMEENLGKNIGQDIQQSSRGVMDDLEKRFEKMTQQLAVIKKYAKHGPSGGERVSDVGVPTGGSPAGTPKMEPGNAASSSTADVLATVSGESKAAIDRLSGSIGEMRTEELKRMMTAISTLDSKVSDVLALDRKIYSEGAKGNVVEEQLEAATHTIIQDMKPGVEKLISLFENEVKTLVEASIDAAKPPPPSPMPNSDNQDLLPALNKMESGLLSGQRECLGLLGEMRETSSRHEESIRDILSHDLRSAVQTLSQTTSVTQVATSATSSSGNQHPAGAAAGSGAAQAALTSTAKMEAVRKLVGYIRRIQVCQTNILQKADQSIEFSRAANEVFAKMVPTLEVIQKALEERQGQNLDSDILPRLCNDLNAKIRNMDELERRHFNDPKSQACRILRIPLIKSTYRAPRIM